MKKLIVLSLGILAATLAFSQMSNVKISEKSMSRGTNESIEITIEGVPLDVAQSQWLKYIKQYKGKTKFDKTTKEYFTDDAKIESLSSNTVDAYATIVEFKGEQKIVATFWFDLGGAFLNTVQNPERIASAQNLIQIYAKNVRIAAAENEYDAEIKILKGLNNDLQSLEKANTKFHDKIADAEKLIQEMKVNIETNISAQSDKNQEIQSQQTAVDKAQAKLASIKS